MEGANSGDVFERASEGRFISLGAMQPTAAQIEMMGNNPFRACPLCDGTGVMALAIVMDDDGELEVAAALPCPDCGGSGMISYITAN